VKRNEEHSIEHKQSTQSEERQRDCPHDCRQGREVLEASLMAVCLKRGCTYPVPRGFRFCRRIDCGKPKGEEEE
jgi:hypothetical protein